ncbi:hypothetical protein GPICK_01800 [Geobacter pickeringii]|uniref:Uncharacterized protein n=2 Tax=Geobacter pickeringii TaxID=345632 RepID=A0A0B5BCI0_9BACT|nr:hypothetical protein GPICK_01800 [Geobacter pickeringii]
MVPARIMGARSSLKSKPFPSSRHPCSIDAMKKTLSLLLIVLVLAVVVFGTWQLFLGNFEAAFSSAPFLLLLYFVVRPQRG